MKYNILGNTGLKVSELCLGTMTFGGKGFWTAIGILYQRSVDEQNLGLMVWSPAWMLELQGTDRKR